MAATNSYIQVAADGSGKKMQTYLATIGSDDVHAEAVRLVDGDLSPLGTSGDSLNVYVTSPGGSSAGAIFMGGGQVLVGGTATTIAAAQATRRSVTIRNQDLTNSGYIGPTNVNTSNGLLLNPLDSISIDYTGVIQGITAGDNVTFGYLETYD